MMGKTHVAMGMAIAALALHPTDVPSCLLAVSGGAVGGVIADIDTVKNDYEHDALFGQLIAIGILCTSLIIDHFAGWGICSSVADRNRILVIVGAVGYLGLFIAGFCSKHRSFTHSLIALILFTAAVFMICPSITAAYAIGYIVHLMLDIMNKKPVPLFYPKGKGICFKWCYANKTANTCFMWVGFVGTIILIINSMFLHVW